MFGLGWGSICRWWFGRLTYTFTGAGLYNRLSWSSVRLRNDQKLACELHPLTQEHSVGQRSLRWSHGRSSHPRGPYVRETFGETLALVWHRYICLTDVSVSSRHTWQSHKMLFKNSIFAQFIVTLVDHQLLRKVNKYYQGIFLILLIKILRSDMTCIYRRTTSAECPRRYIWVGHFSFTTRMGNVIVMETLPG